jgi:hypothetical protein
MNLILLKQINYFKRKNNQTCQWTYNQHKRPITGLLFIETLRVCASCDGALHVKLKF